MPSEEFARTEQVRLAHAAQMMRGGARRRTSIIVMEGEVMHSMMKPLLSAAVRRGLTKSTLTLAIALAAVFGAPKADAQTTTTCVPLTQGFWKNHFPGAWNNVKTLTLGTATYSAAQAEAFLQTPVRGDASLILADQLIAALLNIQVTGTSTTTPTTLVADTITDANKLLGAGPIPEHINPSSTIGQQMVADASILDNFNNGLITTACASTPPPVGSCQPSSSLSALQSGTNVIAYVPKGRWGGSATGVSVVNVEGTLVTNTLIPTGSDVINSCASNSATGQTVCTANNNKVYFTNPGFTPSTLAAFNLTPLTSAGTGTISFSGGSCTNCGVAMDGVHNKAVIGLSLAGVPGFQYLDLGASPTFETAFASQSAPPQISEDVLIDPTRNLLLSPAELGSFEIVNVTTTTTPAFSRTTLPVLVASLIPRVRTAPLGSLSRPGNLVTHP
jgi:hypothetical protein